MNPKSIIFIIIFLYVSHVEVYSQRNPINNYISHLDTLNFQFKGCVKSISVNNLFFKKHDSIHYERDSIRSRVQKLVFSKNGNRITRMDYSNSFNEEPWQIIGYDSLGRVIEIKRKNNDEYSYIIKQYFNGKSVLPDSTNFYLDDNLNQQYINFFRDTIVIRQEHYRRDILKSFDLLEYDNLNRLVKKIWVNTKNGYGVTIDKSLTGDKSIKYLNLNDTIEYKHSMEGDSIVVSKYNKGKLQEIKKEFKSDEIRVFIKEDHHLGDIIYWNHKYFTKDSIFIRHRRLVRDKKSVSDSKTIINNNWIRSSYSINGVVRTDISTIIDISVYDNYNNWIKKTYVKDGKVVRMVEREIEYYFD